MIEPEQFVLDSAGASGVGEQALAAAAVERGFECDDAFDGISWKFVGGEVWQGVGKAEHDVLHHARSIDVRKVAA